MRRLVLLAAFAMVAVAVAAAPRAQAVTCENLAFEGNRYAVCTVNPAQEDLRLYLDDAKGKRIGQFSRLNELAAQNGKRVVFAMNAGMYHENRAPVGHYVEDGKEAMRVISSPGPGNFGLLPNGVFCLTDTRARVYETRDFLAQKPACRDATQSGPMLVIDGDLHPRFLADSTSRYIRNGVGTTKDGKRAVFVISQNLVNFHDFARFFRDGLKLPDALFLDGNISRLYAPDLGRDDLGRRMGPIVAVTEPR
ncbi:phosphodiester glycosidase family protein [Sagittula salina]|uniref:Phosphodiester glycosidase family protein n=1 Tax=Sagittula salina TaxID=2820268 RepID=A0A940MN57_9RHOB|nr:phosphodiester glycosidase family protein [Sagittula salina]MBP0481583.1 phosphodiester glycosidase family protein [Sagittula salina]